MKISKGGFKLVGVMILIIVIGLTFAYFYYDNINKNVDPRLVHTQTVLSQFDNINKLDSPFVALDMMDHLEKELSEIDLYKNSYERGVVINNRASVYIMMALYSSEFANMKDSLLASAQKNLLKAESVFNKWIIENNDISKPEYLKTLSDEYNKETDLFEGKNISKVIQLRIEDIELAKIETPRRLSVTYTNMAVIYRHTNEYEKAVEYYKKAIDLWPKNIEAKNNLNTLFGKKKEKQNVIEKVFPSKRDQ